MSDRPEQHAEDASERTNRELIELLNELRVALPGVQVLFAFLLTVPFTERFDRLDAGDRRVYFGAVLSTAAATLLLVAPTAHHRVRFRAPIKEQLLRVSNALAVVGLILLAGAITAVVYVLSSLLYSEPLAGLAAGSLAGAFIVVWFVVPFAYGGEARREPADPEREGHPR